MFQLVKNQHQVALQSPDFGDSMAPQLNVIIKRSMNNTPFTFVSSNENLILTFGFSNLSRNQVRNFFHFMKLTRGKGVTLRDHNGYNWVGDITTFPTESSHDGVNNSRLTIVFEGIQAITEVIH